MKKLIFTGMVALAMTTMSCGKGNQSSAPEAEKEDMAVAEAVDPANEKLPFEIKDNVIYNENVPVVVDFYADWCQPCKGYAPVFHAVADKYGDAACFVSLNVDEYENLARTYEITTIPTTLFIMPGGGILGKEVGALPEARLVELVNQLVETSAGVDMEI